MRKAKQPKWLENAVFYEIYPQSFCDTNADGIGDFQGIIDRLDYIQELGCNAIWMNPCYMSPFLDAGYDISDYYRTAPRYGTNADIKRLFDELHKRGMHILLDLVPGHTSWDHPWFKESCKAAKNEFTDRYIWTDSTWEGPENMGSLHGISERCGSVGVNFFSHQPALNYGYYKTKKPWEQKMNDPGPAATLEAMMDVMRFWLKLGCDGFRCDMAHSLVKRDENAKGTIAIWNKIRKFLDVEFPDAAMVSEWGEPDKSLAGGFHMDFLLHFGPSHYNDLFRCDEPFFCTRGKGSAKQFVKTYVGNYEKTGGKGLICIPSGNHDMSRLSYQLETCELPLAFAFILSMPGAPFIYYGDEIGMRYLPDIPSVEGGYERTGSRTPMQWDRSANAGFSAAPADALYIRIDPDENRPDAASQMKDPASLWNSVKSMIAFRQRHTCLQSMGEVEFISDTYPLIYRRKDKNESILVIIQPADAPAQVKTDGEIIYTVGAGAEINDGVCTVKGVSAVFIKE
ncbi:MAG: glycosylase [Lachnospiraceae bacterium]|nr:glycosylase [Lachnospiraceae bacterium]